MDNPVYWVGRSYTTRALDEYDLPSVLALLTVFSLLGTLFYHEPVTPSLNHAMVSIQFLTGTLIALVFPGWLLLSLLEYETDRFELLAVLIPTSSLAVTSLTLFIANYLLRLLGVARPFDRPAVVIVLSIVVVGLIVVRERKAEHRVYTQRLATDLNSRAVLALAVAALGIAIAGARLTTAGSPFGNDLLVVALLLIALTPLALAASKTTTVTNTVVIYLSSLAVVFHLTLISQYVWGWDIQHTVYLANWIKQNGFWEISYYNRRTPLFTVTAVPVALSQVTGLSIDWIYKVHTPMLYSLIPVGLYGLARSFLPIRIAPLAPYALIFYQRFFNNIQSKQHTAELFIIAILLVIVYAKRSEIRSWLILLFSFGLVTSHYLMTFLFSGMLVSFVVGLFVLSILPFTNSYDSSRKRVSLAFFALVPTLFAVWYMSAADGYIFQQFVEIPIKILLSLTESAVETEERTGQALVSQSLTMGVTRWIYFGIHATLLGFLGFGVIRSLYQSAFGGGNKNWTYYTLFSLPPLALFGLSMFFQGHYGIDRAYEVMLLVGSPFVVLGFVSLREVMLRLSGISFPARRAAAVLLALFLLFNSGAVHFVLAIDQDPNPIPQSFGLERDKIWAEYDEQELQAAQWTVDHRDNARMLYTDSQGQMSVYRYRNAWQYSLRNDHTQYYAAASGLLFAMDPSTMCGPSQRDGQCLSAPTMGHQIYENGRSDVYLK